MNIIAVVVTFNRFNLLRKGIEVLKDINLLSKIVVVDNHSTDGTAEWLDSQSNLTVIHQGNIGGAGGFYTGINQAYKDGADWIWCMDDDVFPCHDCLQKLLLQSSVANVGILCPRRIMDGAVFVNECKEVNMNSIFKSMHQKRVPPDISEPIVIEGMVFEGPLIKREVVESIGLPNKDLFIFYDDTDYSYRATLAGYKVLYVPDAIMMKEKFFIQLTWSEKLEKKRWKHLYQLRNSAFFNHHYGQNIGVKYVRSWFSFVGYVAGEILYMVKNKKNTWSDIAKLWKAYKAGVSERLNTFSTIGAMS